MNMRTLVLAICFSALCVSSIPVNLSKKLNFERKPNVRTALLSSIGNAEASVVKAKVLELVQALPEALLKQILDHPTAASFVEVKDTCRLAAFADKGVSGETCTCGVKGYKDVFCADYNVCADGQRYQTAGGTLSICTATDLPVDLACERAAPYPYHCCCRSGSCLAPETDITLYNGSVSQIKDVQPGDVVRSASGRPAKVLSVDVAPASGRVLYPLGGSEKPFISEDHFLVTDTGLAAIDLTKALEFEPTLEKRAAALTTSSRLQIFNPQTKTISSKAVSAADLSEGRTFQPVPDQPLYNLVLESEHTYIANNVVVYDMFPDLSQAPYSYKLLHWILRDNVKKVESFFAARPGASKYAMKPLVQEISAVIDSFIATQDKE